MAKLSALALGWLQFFDGKGTVPQDPGNELNPPGDPPVQVGTYQFIPDYALQKFGHNATDFAPVPMAYRDWGQFPLNVGDPSGLTGGGYAQDPQVAMPMETNLFFDPSTGLYYDLGSTS
jgi:hypothetical protein